MASLLGTCGCGCGEVVTSPKRFIHGHNGRLRAYPIYTGPPRLCECGCGQQVSLADRTSQEYGHIKGQPVRFIPGHHRRGVHPPLEERFHSRVAKRGPDDCWEWTAGRLPHGYGALWDGRIGNNQATHRLAWEFAYGPVRDDLWVLHRCDNPPCCNPAHLFLGTNADNSADRATKGRGSRGMRHPDAKLNPAAVRTIRERFAEGESCRDLARDFGVSRATVNDVVKYKTWRHIT